MYNLSSSSSSSNNNKNVNDIHRALLLNPGSLNGNSQLQQQHHPHALDATTIMPSSLSSSYDDSNSSNHHYYYHHHNSREGLERLAKSMDRDCLILFVDLFSPHSSSGRFQ
jgi:hypothetical protein